MTIFAPFRTMCPQTNVRKNPCFFVFRSPQTILFHPKKRFPPKNQRCGQEWLRNKRFFPYRRYPPYPHRSLRGGMREYRQDAAPFSRSRRIRGSRKNRRSLFSRKRNAYTPAQRKKICGQADRKCIMSRFPCRSYLRLLPRDRRRDKAENVRRDTTCGHGAEERRKIRWTTWSA